VLGRKVVEMERPEVNRFFSSNSSPPIFLGRELKNVILSKDDESSR